VIIDELGYVPLSQTGAELLFEVFSQRYERGSTIVTSNLPFDEWTSVFGVRTAHRCAARPAYPSRPYPADECRQLQAQSEQAPLTPFQLGHSGGSSQPSLMPDEKPPVRGGFLPTSLMYFCSGEPMHFCSDVDGSAAPNGSPPTSEVIAPPSNAAAT
jgi:hypothetical protein